jgi:hypothetical protein
VSSKFTFEIRWTKKGYWVNIFEGSGETMNEAKVKALALAREKRMVSSQMVGNEPLERFPHTTP